MVILARTDLNLRAFSLRGALLADHKRMTNSQLCINQKKRPFMKGDSKSQGLRGSLSWECLQLELHERKHNIRSERKEGLDLEGPIGQGRSAEDDNTASQGGSED